MIDSEMMALCRRVYGLTDWDHGTTTEKSFSDDGVVFGWAPGNIPIYTAECLFAHLIDHGIEPTLNYISHNTEISLYRYRIDLLGKFTAYHPTMMMGEYEGSDSPAKALLKLVIYLIKHGEIEV